MNVEDLSGCGEPESDLSLQNQAVRSNRLSWCPCRLSLTEKEPNHGVGSMPCTTSHFGCKHASG